MFKQNVINSSPAAPELLSWQNWRLC